jgi:hypothetical protein
VNLFDEIGFAVRMQVAAELAAAVQVSLGLKIQDFLDLAQQDPQMQGLPIDLLRVFLSEITISAGVYAKAALTAQAYAQLVITGTAIAQPAQQIQPGFNIVAGVGAGLKAGAGFRFFAAMEFDSVARFVARTVDLLVDSARDAAQAALAPASPQVSTLLIAARPVFKTTFRIAYEVGEYVALNAPAASSDGAQSVALRSTQVVLEEGQRFLLKCMTDAAFDALREAIRAWTGLLPQRWATAAAARNALANHLRQFPAEPFDGTPAATTYWSDLLDKVIDLAVALSSGNIEDRNMRSIAILWCAAQLALVANRAATPTRILM